MPNIIELASAWVPMLDEVYQSASQTGLLDGAPGLARAGANAHELIVQKIDMDGLADYDKDGGYVIGTTRFESETITANFDKGLMIPVDAMDDIETMRMAFGRLAGEFIRTKVVPYLDAFRLSAYASAPGVSAATPAVLNNGADITNALRECANAMDNAEVPDDQRILYALPEIIGIVEDMDTIKSRAVLSRFGTIIRMPQSRMNTDIMQKTSDGYGFETGGATINFMALHKPAVIQFTKHLAPKVITPEANQRADGWLFGYHIVSVARVYENKAHGIYVHAQA